MTGAVLVQMNTGAAGFSFTPTISVDTYNYNVSTAALAAGWDGVQKLFATITVASGIFVGSTSTGTYSFTNPAGLPVGSVVLLVNNGYILGCGNSGPALNAQFALSLDNLYGTIGGGGGQGGAGADFDVVDLGAGGGGGAGYDPGDGSFGGDGSQGDSGTAFAGGSGAGSGGAGGNGGSGGGLGQAGASGQTSGGHPGSSGGSAGVAINGVANVTFVNTGLVYGSQV